MESTTILRPLAYYMAAPFNFTAMNGDRPRRAVVIHSIVAVFALIVTVLHIIRPSMDFWKDSSVYLLLSFLAQIAFPFSACYETWLVSRAGCGDFESRTPVGNFDVLIAESLKLLKPFAQWTKLDIVRITGTLCAFNFTVDIFRFSLTLLLAVQHGLPTHEPRNYESELAWLGFPFVALGVCLVALMSNALLWMPVISMQVADQASEDKAPELDEIHQSTIVPHPQKSIPGSHETGF